MANTFKIVISATDKATSSVRRINDSISKMTRPLTNVARSAKSLGKELSRNPAVKVLKTIAGAAKGVAASIGGVAVSMAALVGFGSLAGLGVMVTEWGRLGFEVSKTSSLLDVSTTSLQRLRGAAQLAGNSPEELTAGLGTLRQNLQDARWGRNQGVLMLMNRLGISFRRTANGSVDVVGALKDVSDAVAKQKDIGAKHTIAQAFGIESLLPLLMKGRKGIEEYENKANELAGFKGSAAIEQARAFGQRLNEMMVSVGGLKASIGNALLPVLDPLVKRFTDLISINREAIGEKVGEWAKRFGDWIGSIKKEDFERFESNIMKIGNAVGFVIGKLADMISLFQKISGNRFFNIVIDAIPGLSSGVPGMLTDLLSRDKSGKQTSSGKIGTATGSQNAASGQGDGVAQATNSAANVARGIRNNNPGNLRNWGGMPSDGGYAVFPTPAAGISAMTKQLQLYGMRGIDTLNDVISTWAPKSDKNDTRSYIDDVSRQTGFSPNARLNLSDKSTLAPLISAMIRHENGSNPYDKKTVDDAVSHVVVEFKNAPPGTTAVARSKGGSDVPVRINHTLPTLAAG